MADRTYTIHVTTGDDLVAGTDAGVYLEMTGSGGSSGEFELGGDIFAFETGQTDRFVVSLPDLGEVAEACLRLDEANEDGWYVETLGVEDDAGGIWSFTFERWLGEESGTLRACVVADEFD